MLTAARREAEAIRIQAEQRARRVLEEAAARAWTVQAEREDASQRELDSLLRLRRDVANCLEVSDAALRDARELMATETRSLALFASESEDLAETPSTWSGTRRLASTNEQPRAVFPSDPASHLAAAGSGREAESDLEASAPVVDEPGVVPGDSVAGLPRSPRSSGP